MSRSRHLSERPRLRAGLAFVFIVLVCFTGYIVVESRAAGLVIGDLNGDGAVNVFDLSQLLGAWGTSNASINANLGTTGTVGVVDLSILLSHWGNVASPTPTQTQTPTPTMTPSPTPSASPVGGNYWTPPANAEWQWEIGHALVLSSASDMGTGKTAYTGATAPATDPEIYDIDGIDNPASTVSSLHALGKKVICYMEVGTQGSYYTATQEGIATTYYDQLKAAGVLSTNTLPGYAQENFVNINSPAAVTILEAEIQQQCQHKGFDAVETDLDETFGNNEGTTPWTITQANEESFLEALSGYMHSNGLGWIAKNLDDVDNLSFVTNLEPHAQGMISEESNAFSSTAMWVPFESADKWIGNAEYSQDDSMTLAKFCPADNAHANVNGVLFNSSGSLDGPRSPCR